MTAVDPLAGQTGTTDGSVNPLAATADVPAPAPAAVPAPNVTDVPDERWKTALAVIGGLMGGDNYPPDSPPPLPALNTDALSSMTMQNENQQLQQQAIKEENAALQNQQAGQAPAAAPPAAAQGGDWRVDVLNGIRAPITEQNLDVLAKWQKTEGGGGVAGGPTPSNYNWLNTNRNMPGASSINSVGVKSYASYGDGVNATIGALNNGHYGNIIAALRAGNDEMAVAEAIEQSPWGTGSGVIRLLAPGGGPMRMR